MKAQAAFGLGGGELWLFGRRHQLDDDLLALVSVPLDRVFVEASVESFGSSCSSLGCGFFNPSAAFDCAHSIPGDSAFAHSGALSGKINVSLSAGDCRQRNRLDLRAATICLFLHLISNGLRKNTF